MRVNRAGGVVALTALLLAGFGIAVDAGSREDDDIVAEDEVPTLSSTVPPTKISLTCDWRELSQSGNDRFDTGRYLYFHIDARYWRADPETGELWVRSTQICSRGEERVSSRIGWELLTDPDPRIIADVLRDRQAKNLPLPDPELNPVGPGYVQLGMWLAVDDPGPESVTASAVTGSWVTVTAQISQTTFDMGNGDVVVCDGVGAPIPEWELDSVDESPVCGYTYRRLNDGDPYTITITTTWAVSFTSSRGTSGVLEPVTKTASFDYEVLEIQTVGGYGDD